jgi:hypothetical protein
MGYIIQVIEIHPSARKHGIADVDIVHALAFAFYRTELGEDPIRVLHLGPDHAGNPLEIITIDRQDAWPLAIHAMSMRTKYWPLVRREKR